MNLIARYRIIILLLLFPIISFAQNRDFVLWEGFSLKYELSDKWSAELKNQLRLENNVSQFKSAFVTPGITYKINSAFRVSMGYRYSLTPTQNKHRVDLNFEHRYKIKKIKLQLKTRLKFQRESIGNEQNEIPEYFIRPRITAVYKIKPIDLETSFSTELFYDLTKYKQEFNRYRFNFGISYDITKRNSLSLNYIYQQAFNVPNRVQVNILSLGLSADITQKAKKEKQPK